MLADDRLLAEELTEPLADELADELADGDPEELGLGEPEDPDDGDAGQLPQPNVAYIGLPLLYPTKIAIVRRLDGGTHTADVDELLVATASSGQPANPPMTAIDRQYRPAPYTGLPLLYPTRTVSTFEPAATLDDEGAHLRVEYTGFPLLYPTRTPNPAELKLDKLDGTHHPKSARYTSSATVHNLVSLTYTTR